MLRRIFGPAKDEVSEHFRIFHKRNFMIYTGQVSELQMFVMGCF